MKAAEALERYRQALIRYGAALDAGKSKAANEAFDEAVRLSHLFRNGGPDLQRDFLALIEDENVWVRFDVATCALEFAPARAVPALREIAAGFGLVAFNAEKILEQWEAGTLRLA
ncbi:MAG TPA: hypothetical protein VH877_23735 [Polyangia bacterium]|jgi:hypothetical protein|nr:hypothetical protein [Polyangia bacterium]